jgi:hypothetical protein
VRITVSPRVAALVLGPVVSLLARSWRLTTIGEARWLALADAGRAHMFLLWHEALLPLLWKHRARGVTIVVSGAQDGRYLAEYARRLGYREARGSSTRGGVRALLGAVKAMRGGGTAAFTPDGPNGPRRELKGAALVAAQKAGVPVVTLHADADRAWRLHSWDRFLIPKPFARVRIVYGAPFSIEEGAEGLAHAERRARQELDHAVREAEWDAGATVTA